MTAAFFTYLVTLSLTGFIIFAFTDSICLRFDLYDKAPTPDNVVFNKDDDRLFLQGTRQIIGDQSSMQAYREFNTVDISRGDTSRNDPMFMGVDGDESRY